MSWTMTSHAGALMLGSVTVSVLKCSDLDVLAIPARRLSGLC
jgi:nucleotide-binding universal stress UspA family protein